MNKVKSISSAALVLGVIVALAGCQIRPPADAFRLSETSLQDRQQQIRVYETQDEAALLSAGVGILQDMGYNIEETETNVGLITASKTVDATDGAQIAGAVAMALLFGANMATDTTQTIRASMVTYPSKSKKGEGFISRVTFQRATYNTQGGVRVETLKMPELYMGFFDKLNKSVFLEGQGI